MVTISLSFFIEILNVFDIVKLQVISRLLSTIFIILMIIVAIKIKNKSYKKIKGDKKK